jgi:hypothetical protein
MPCKAMQDAARRQGPQIITSTIPVTDELQRNPLMAELN